MHHMPTSPTDTYHVLHQLLSPLRTILCVSLHGVRIHLRTALGVRVRHAEPEHADDAPGHVLAALGAHGPGLVVREDGGAAGG